MMSTRPRRRMPRKLAKTISDQLERAWEQGKAARAAGQPPDNPYRSGCDCARMWAGGYQHATEPAAYAPSQRTPRARPGPNARRKPGGRGLSLAALAGTLCSNPAFQTWCGTADADEAAAWVRRVCGVTSRRELDTTPAAAQAFEHQVRRPWRASRES